MAGHVPSGKVSDEIVLMTDLFPTFLAAAGAKPDPAWKVDGLNILPAWLGLGKIRIGPSSGSGGARAAIKLPP